MSTHREEQARARRLANLPRRTYRFRILGMGLGALPLIAVMHELDSPWVAWAWVAFTCFLWPHLALFLALRSRDPFRAELRNFLLDSVFAGSYAPLMHFNVLPSAVLLSVVMADKVNTGVRGLWLRSLPGMAGAIIVGGLFTGFAWQPETSMTVLLASLPILVIHTLAVSLSSYQLVRRVQSQNLQLEELSQRDALTGLASRGHWETETGMLLASHQQQGQTATLILLDVDRFKAINDRHGHGAGDDVLRGVADLLRVGIPEGARAGRLGGDEFVITLPLPLADAELVAERLRAAVEAQAFAEVPGLTVSISLGLAEAPGIPLGLREWLEAADRALYRAKQAGRNRLATSAAKLADGAGLV